MNSGGCDAQVQRALEPQEQSSPDETQMGIIIGGDTGEWTAINSGIADERYVYLHFSPRGGSITTLQAASLTTRIRIDTDLDPRTGRPMGWMSLTADIQQPQGVDLLVELSPKNELGSLGIGSAVTRYDGSDLNGKSIGHAAIGFMFLPTYASSAYEVRIDRLAPGAEALTKSGLIEIVIDQVDVNDRFLWSTTMQVELPAIGTRTHSDATIPVKPAQSVRVMSANVLFSSPLENSDPFARVLGAIEPDVILYQEWFNTPIEDVQGWLNTHAGSGWNVHMPDSKAGVAIATRKKIIQTYDAVLPPSGEGRPARAAAALIETDMGELLAISVHLKCCGSAGSEEDIKRIEQAQAINGFVRSVRLKHPNAQVVIAGDFNLVGSREPLEVLAKNLGKKGGGLTASQPLHLGDSTMVTWNDEKSRFSPGRLDWMLYDDSMSDIADAFIVDTRVLSEQSLKDAGLDADDSKASDHLPIVIDLIKSR